MRQFARHRSAYRGKVEWVDNNSGCQETCGRVPTQQLKQDCPEGLCYDEQLIGHCLATVFKTAITGRSILGIAHER